MRTCHYLSTVTDMATTGPRVGIRKLREAHGLTIPQLVERITEQGGQVSADHVSNVELGYKKASAPLLSAWAKALNLHPLDVEPAPAAPVAQRLTAAAS